MSSSVKCIKVQDPTTLYFFSCKASSSIIHNVGVSEWVSVCHWNYPIYANIISFLWLVVSVPCSFLSFVMSVSFTFISVVMSVPFTFLLLVMSVPSTFLQKPIIISFIFTYLQIKLKSVQNLSIYLNQSSSQEPLKNLFNFYSISISISFLALSGAQEMLIFVRMVQVCLELSIFIILAQVSFRSLLGLS